MWLNILIDCFLWIIPIAVVQCHLPDYVSTPSSKVEQFCVLAEKCIHDTIPICGRSGEEMRTFLDLCDLLEYACDSNNGCFGGVVKTHLWVSDLHECIKYRHESDPIIFTHIEDTVGCPIPKPGPKV